MVFILVLFLMCNLRVVYATDRIISDFEYVVEAKLGKTYCSDTEFSVNPGVTRSQMLQSMSKIYYFKDGEFYSEKDSTYSTDIIGSSHDIYLDGYLYYSSQKNKYVFKENSFPYVCISENAVFMSETPFKYYPNNTLSQRLKCGDKFYYFNKDEESVVKRTSGYYMEDLIWSSHDIYYAEGENYGEVFFSAPQVPPWILQTDMTDLQKKILEVGLVVLPKGLEILLMLFVVYLTPRVIHFFFG